MSEFFNNTIPRHIHRLVSEKEYYEAQARESRDPKTQQGHILMAEFYDQLIEKAQEIADKLTS
jgi:hypothetical protein